MRTSKYIKQIVKDSNKNLAHHTQKKHKTQYAKSKSKQYKTHRGGSSQNIGTVHNVANNREYIANIEAMQSKNAKLRADIKKLKYEMLKPSDEDIAGRRYSGPMLDVDEMYTESQPPPHFDEGAKQFAGRKPTYLEIGDEDEEMNMETQPPNFDEGATHLDNRNPDSPETEYDDDDYDKKIQKLKEENKQLNTKIAGMKQSYSFKQTKRPRVSHPLNLFSTNPYYNTRISRLFNEKNSNTQPTKKSTAPHTLPKTWKNVQQSSLHNSNSQALLNTFKKSTAPYTLQKTWLKTDEHSLNNKINSGSSLALFFDNEKQKF